jgi:acylphosphatase
MRGPLGIIISAGERRKAVSSLVRRLRAGSPVTHTVMTERVRAVVHGRVQAVGFRAFVYDRARFHGLHGWVRNRPDGTVECLAEGRRTDIDAFLADLREGPPSARVKDVETIFEAARGDLETFDVRF